MVGIVLVTLACAFLALYIAILLGAGYVALHPPRSPIFFSPGAMGFATETFDFTNRHGTRLRATWCPHEDAAGVIVLIHGYCMNRSELAVFTPLFRAHGLSCLFVDLRNHGQSARSRCGIGYWEREDVADAVAQARARCPGKPVILMGSSMGAAACAFAAGEERDLADALILDSTYDSLFEATDGWWHFLGKMTVAPRLWRLAFAPLARVAKLALGFSPREARVSRAMNGYDRPVLLLHGRVDTIAPLPHAENVLGALAGRKDLCVFDHCDHAEMRWLQPERYGEAVGAFLTSMGLPPRVP